MITLTIWSDFACPYCYIGEKRLQKAIEEMGLTDEVTVDFRAYELNPFAPKEYIGPTPERFAQKYQREFGIRTSHTPHKYRATLNRATKLGSPDLSSSGSNYSQRTI